MPGFSHAHSVQHIGKWVISGSKHYRYLTFLFALWYSAPIPLLQIEFLLIRNGFLDWGYSWGFQRLLVLTNEIIFNWKWASQPCGNHNVHFHIIHHLHVNSARLFIECLLYAIHVLRGIKGRFSTAPGLVEFTMNTHLLRPSITDYWCTALYFVKQGA